MMLELEGFDRELVTLLDSSTDSESRWEGNRLPDFATISGRDWVTSRGRTGVTILEEWQTCIVDRGIIHPF